MDISFEKLVSRDIVRMMSNELDLAGIKMSVERLFYIAIVGGILVLIISSFSMLELMKQGVVMSAIIGIVSAILYELVIYAVLEFLIDKRKTFLEGLLADYLQITSANVRSGLSLDKAMVMAARPEFKYFSDDIMILSEQVYAGQTMDDALINLGNKYRSTHLKHTIRLIIESIQYGGGVTDLLNQVAKDIRNQQLIQKEIAGQLFMYIIFISFASLIAAPMLYALTTQMVQITNTIWSGILQENPGGLPSQGMSFLKPSPPQISIQDYKNFAIESIIVITGFCAFIISTISTGSAIKGLKYMPVFIICGFLIYYIASIGIGHMLSNVAGGG